ncbi:hypothetical protein MJG53_006361 [Ovis ammon polii x Ovis aries]|uniref:Uncharacterized protein n=1 Tax=Ovis ammon polii x Ovis aries TaxID=2918886 RepID=A0ACB9V563_9CETA|nr:hypothetical protein MJG53_006361 [Ovis ammon polii x Ovis aries]
MERSSWAPRTFLLALLLGATLRARAAVGYYPRFSPFFFLCTHHGELEGDGEQGEVLISLHIAGHPTYYVPGQEYHDFETGCNYRPSKIANDGKIGNGNLDGPVRFVPILVLSSEVLQFSHRIAFGHIDGTVIFTMLYFIMGFFLPKSSGVKLQESIVDDCPLYSKQKSELKSPRGEVPRGSDCGRPPVCGTELAVSRGTSHLVVIGKANKERKEQREGSSWERWEWECDNRKERVWYFVKYFIYIVPFNFHNSVK